MITVSKIREGFRGHIDLSRTVDSPEVKSTLTSKVVPCEKCDNGITSAVESGRKRESAMYAKLGRQTIEQVE